VFLAVGSLSVIGFAQERPFGPTPFGDKHVGGDVPFDERMEEARVRGRGTVAQPPEDRVIKKGVLAPSKDDRAAYTAFLRTPETGLIRLLPLESINYQQRQQNISVNGAHYSFANVTHFPGYGSDLQLNSNALAVGFAGHGYGLMTNLGDVSLAAVTLTDPRTRFITDYSPAIILVEARGEALRFRGGETIDGVHYQERVPVEVNSTYLLRSINYNKPMFASNAPVRSAGKRRTDVLVVFRVIRQESDGSVTIAWKLLKKYSAPDFE
jgi:hypothetical protein